MRMRLNHLLIKKFNEQRNDIKYDLIKISYVPHDGPARNMAHDMYTYTRILRMYL